MKLSIGVGMTAPRDVRPGVLWFVTRRTVRRTHLFSPDADGRIEQLYWYLTAVYAQRLGVELHMMQLMSTHPHEVLTDTRGELPRFFELRNGTLAKALKVLLGWSGEVFDSCAASWVELPTPEAAIQEIAYTVANCVAAGLVSTPRQWPGAKVLVDDVGRRVVRVKRPDFYFNPKNPKWPDEVTIPILMPRMLQQAFGSDDDAREAIQSQVDRLVRKAHRNYRKSGLTFVGRKRILRMRHTRRATSRERAGDRNPTFATAGDAEVTKRLIEQRRAFRAAYRRAWHAWKTGTRDVEFPAGTWKMRELHGAQTRPHHAV